jgi:hypothetical protein
MAPENFQPSFHALAIINLIGASQALLSAAALFSAQRGNPLSNRYFAFFLAALSVYIIMVVLLETGYIVRVPYLMDCEINVNAGGRQRDFCQAATGDAAREAFCRQHVEFAQACQKAGGFDASFVADYQRAFRAEFF